MRLSWLAGLSLLLAPSLGLAAESAAVATARTTVTLVSEADSVQAGKPVRLGLRFRMAPGWHIYWQNPGDAGMPPDIAWTLPAGAAAGDIQWPGPDRIAVDAVISYVYSDEIVLPVSVTPGADGLAARAEANWLVCEKICVPEEGSFTLNLPKGDGAASALAPLFAAADARRPVPSPFAATFAPDGTLRLRGEGLSTQSVAEAWFFPAAWGAIDQNAAQVLQPEAGGLALRLKPGAEFAAAKALDGVLMLRDPRGSASYLTVRATPGGAGPESAPVGFLNVLLLALAGGLVLNLMPCVFPVLAMKALGIARMSAAERGAVRAQAASYTAGVVVAFLAIGGGMLALRATGAALGWGFQFQSPVFVALMAWLMFTVGLNLSGVFEIGHSMAGVGQKACMWDGHLGSFFTGLLAVVVASPCTAPFMGSALAAASTAPPAASMAIFATLGVGLALPYLTFALLPGLARRLPRPGPWMTVLRQALAFPMYGAAIWLLWVAGQQMGPDGVLIVAGGMGLLGFAGWVYGITQHSHGRGRRVGQALTLVAVLGALVLLPAANAAAPGAVRTVEGTEPYSAARLAELRAQGRPVFIDMTAAWCVTCIVNERVALAPRAVREEFVARNVVLMRGDWTRQDKEITAYLRASGRDGVPLYVWYAPGREGVVLPQILTPDIVLSHLKQSS